MQITRLHLTNFGGFREFTIDLAPCTVLIGPNNGGKTTILRAIDFAFTAFRRANHVGRTSELNAIRLQTAERDRRVTELKRRQVTNTRRVKIYGICSTW